MVGRVKSGDVCSLGPLFGQGRCSVLLLLWHSLQDLILSLGFGGIGFLACDDDYGFFATCYL